MSEVMYPVPPSSELAESDIDSPTSYTSGPGTSLYSHQPLVAHDSNSHDASPGTAFPAHSISPPPRSSTESGSGRASTSRRRDSIGAQLDRSNTTAAVSQADTSIVEPSFDESVLRQLCDIDCGVPLLLDRIKQSMVSCREASVFFKKRAVLEEEYGRSMQKLARSTAEVYAMNDGKAGTYVNAWQSTMKIHEAVADNRMRFAQRLNDMSEELATLAKEVDKNRKQTKEMANRYERALQESEMTTEKSKLRFDMTAEELERVLVQKEGESLKDAGLQGRSPGGVGGKRALGKAVAKGGLLLKGKNPGNLLRQEDDVRSRMSTASDTYKKSVTETQTMRQEYFNFQLPRILRSLKECADEIDLGTQYHLTRYAFLFESVVLGDGTTLAPSLEEGGGGLKETLECIDNKIDFRTYMQNYAYARGPQTKGPRREGPWEEGFVAPLPQYVAPGQGKPPHMQQPPLQSNASNGSVPEPQNTRTTFGVDLAEQMARDGADVPPILSKCCDAIEKYGLQSQGIYRISGTMTKVNKLKEKLDREIAAVDLDAEEWSSDINNVSSVLKLWFRELPDPLFTFHLQAGFIEAAKIESDRLRHIRLHERVNDLPDANYATLKYLMGHLHTVLKYELQNSMTVQNLSIVFGPTLFGQMTPDQMVNGGMADTQFQNKAVQTILEHYEDIFVDEGEEQPEQ